MEKEYEFYGIGLNDTLDSGKTEGRIVLTGHSLRFDYTGGVVELPFQDLKITRGGSSGHLVFLQHDARPGWMVYTQDRSILDKIKKLSRPELSEQVVEYKKKQWLSRALVIWILVAIALVAVILLQLREPVSKAIARNIPVEWEQALGESVFAEYKAGRTFIDDTEVTTSLQSLTAPLLDHIPEKRYKFHIHIAQDPTINAFALPGGYVVLNTGLIMAAETGEEVLGVLAHEIAHVTKQHGMRRMIESLGLFLLAQALFGDASGVWGAVLENGAFLLNQSFSRDMERDADETGFAYMLSAGINPSGLLTFFDKLYRESKESGSDGFEEALNFLSTHPAPSKRIEYLNKKLKALGSRSNYQEFDKSFHLFKEAVKQKLNNPAAEAR